ncbi:two-component system, OmpR family, response regulator MtrA [Myxococcus fulvus]|uniref:DNA-binding response regulator n=1 Tax=Myxococcus fulvus TaxID=33 RepID=A0A511TFZ9_MYXFU|nr:response regulator transcription factor [Myxococcus fulvus]GEN12583.1 DNA-binding response regulator [Myxococcus fulvus]SET84748.1 two-component system, OmpR family, response regulator MtrA [Myxococcus fulvus]
MGERILLVEDDARLGAQIVEHLTGAGFEAEWWTEGRMLLPGELPDVRLVVLDLMLPGTYGLDMLKALRGFSEVPVLILSARNDTLDKVRALKLGADDYLTKPFWPEELIERVRARLRRPVLQKPESVLELGPLRVDFLGREVRVEGRVVELTRVEFEVLAALARRPREAVTRQWLVEHVLDPEREGTERTLDVHVSRLRRKLAPAQCVETVWGVGYRLVAGDGS